MSNKRLEIYFIVDIEVIPQITSNHHSAKSVFFCQLDVVQVHASHRKNMAVDESFLGGFFYLQQVERGFLCRIFNAIENLLQENIVGFALCFSQQLYVRATACDATSNPFGDRIGELLKMDA